MIELPMRWPLVIQVTLLSLSFVWSVHLCCLRVLVSCSWYIHCVLLLIKIRGNWFIRDFFRSPNCWCLFICTQHPSESIQGKFLKKRLVDPQELQQSDWVRDSYAVFRFRVLRHDLSFPPCEPQDAFQRSHLSSIHSGSSSGASLEIVSQLQCLWRNRLLITEWVKESIILFFTLERWQPISTSCWIWKLILVTLCGHLLHPPNSLDRRVLPHTECAFATDLHPSKSSLFL